ncbi:hypothetical protein DICA3_F01618 [Diutina catenulata]
MDSKTRNVQIKFRRCLTRVQPLKDDYDLPVTQIGSNFAPSLDPPTQLCSHSPYVSDRCNDDTTDEELTIDLGEYHGEMASRNSTIFLRCDHEYETGTTVYATPMSIKELNSYLIAKELEFHKAMSEL